MQKDRQVRAALVLFPFKAYILIAFPFLNAFGKYSVMVVPTHSNNGHTTMFVSVGYLAAVFALLFGALAQRLLKGGGSPAWSLGFAVLGLVFLWMLAPWGTLIL